MIEDVAFQGRVCAISRASSSLMTQAVKGKTTQEAKRIFGAFRELITKGEDADLDGVDLGDLEVLAGRGRLSIPGEVRQPRVAHAEIGPRRRSGAGVHRVAVARGNQCISRSKWTTASVRWSTWRHTRTKENVRAADIAKRQHIPVAFLDRLMGSLSKEGLVHSYRGPQGGHALGKDASDFSLGMVMESVGATETVVGCLEDPGLCVHVPGCSQTRDLARGRRGHSAHPGRDEHRRPGRPHGAGGGDVDLSPGPSPPRRGGARTGLISPSLR